MCGSQIDKQGHPLVGLFPTPSLTSISSQLKAN